MQTRFSTRFDFGEGDMRKLSPKQISETFKRYRDVNHKQAQNSNL